MVTCQNFGVATYLSCLQEYLPDPKIIQAASLSNRLEKSIEAAFTAELGLNVEMTIVLPAIDQLYHLARVAQSPQDGHLLQLRLAVPNPVERDPELLDGVDPVGIRARRRPRGCRESCHERSRGRRLHHAIHLRKFAFANGIRLVKTGYQRLVDVAGTMAILRSDAQSAVGKA